MIYRLTSQTKKYYILGANRYFKQMASLLRKNNQDNLFQILISETFHVCILNLIDSQKLSEAEIKSVLRSYQWIFNYCKQQKLFGDLYYVVSLSEAVLAKNYNHALHIVRAIQLFRLELLQTLEGKAWLEGQLENHKKALENLKAWTEQKESIINTQQETINTQLETINTQQETINTQQETINTQLETIDRYHLGYWVKKARGKFKGE